MVQLGKDTRLCRCTSQHFNPENSCLSNTLGPIGNSKYSTVNYMPPSGSARYSSISRFQHNFDSSPRHYYRSQQQQYKSSWEKNTGSSCLKGFMKFIQHRCYPKRKPNIVYSQQVVIFQEDVVCAMRQLKCDLERIRERERKSGGTLNEGNDEETARKILSRMACKIYEIEDKLMKTNTLTCGELITRRKIILNLIKTLQKTIGCYLEYEVEALKIRQAKLCNLLRCLQCLESEFRCMTKGIKSQCCSKAYEGGQEAPLKSKLTLPPNYKKSNQLRQVNSYTNITPSNNYEIASIDVVPNHKKSIQLSQIDACTNITPSNNYEITSIDVVYTKSKIKSLESRNIDHINDGNFNRREEEEEINKKVSCHIPLDGQPVCEMKIKDGNETLQLCESQPLKETLCQISNIWYESARQLIDAFHSC